MERKKRKIYSFLISATCLFQQAYLTRAVYTTFILRWPYMTDGMLKSWKYLTCHWWAFLFRGTWCIGVYVSALQKRLPFCRQFRSVLSCPLLDVQRLVIIIVFSLMILNFVWKFRALTWSHTIHFSWLALLIYLSVYSCCKCASVSSEYNISEGTEGGL